MEKLEGFHVAIIMDGNGRWATRRRLPRPAGHRAGVKAVRGLAPACRDLGIRILTLYAFSSDNWKRPADEVEALMNLLLRFLKEETKRCNKHGIRLNIIGRRDRISPDLCAAIESAEQATAQAGQGLLRIAFDYSARDAIVRASRSLAATEIDERVFAERLQTVHNAKVLTSPVDLLIRTGGEQRLSDFLLWESAYAEFYFCQKAWPDFRKNDLAEAVAEFERRKRRFGGLVQIRENLPGSA